MVKLYFTDDESLCKGVIPNFLELCDSVFRREIAKKA